jgi:hypothetical protein
MTREEMKRVLDEMAPPGSRLDDMHFVLDDDNNVVKTGAYSEYILWWMDNEHRRVVRQEDIGEGRFLSTVFLGVNLVSYLRSTTPLVFETALLREDGPIDILDRYATYDGAVAGHEMYKQKILEGQTPLV